MDPGGGGINVARTVLALGEPVPAVLPAGGPTGDVLQGLPPGVPADFYQLLAERVAQSGCRFVLDTSGEALRRVRHSVFLMKPSARERAEYTGRELPDRESQVTAARELIADGVSEFVVVSLGADSALAVGPDSWETLPATAVSIASAVGAGDAMVAGTTVGFARGLSRTEAMQLGIAAASATSG